jgi:hypothetical protein
MKKMWLLVGCCLVMTQAAFGVSGALSKPLSKKAFVGKRLMEGTEEVDKFKASLKDKAEIKEEGLTEGSFVKNYKQLFAKRYAKDADGSIICIQEVDDTGKTISHLPMGKKVKPATAQEVWGFLNAGDTIYVRRTVQESCGLCEGNRYVIYFPEEIVEFKEYYKENHKKHDWIVVSPSYRDAARKECSELAARADLYGWNEVSYRAIQKYNIPSAPCCWTAVHEKGMRKSRHTCPICKGKKKMPVSHMIQFTVEKE